MALQLLAFLIILSLMMVLHELGHFITARRAGITVLEFGFGLPPRLWGLQRGGVIYSINLIPFGAFVRMLGEEDPTEPGSFARQGKLVRAIVLAAGSGMNFLLAVVAFSLAYMTGAPQPVEGEVQIARVAPSSPAEQAGLQEGDLVVSLAGRAVTQVDEFRSITQDHLGQPMPIVVRRAGQTVEGSVVPRPNPPEGQGAVGVAISQPVRLQQQGPLQSIALGFERTVFVIGQTLAVPVLAIRGLVPAELVRPIGLPGMAQMAGDAARASVDEGWWYPILALTGTFSAGLAIANMLPIPALDGGRLLFVVIEAIRGRKISPEREGMFHFVGIVVLITLMVAVSLNDVISPLPSIDWSPR